MNRAAVTSRFVQFLDWFGSEIRSGQTGTFSRSEFATPSDRDYRVTTFSGQFCADGHPALVQVELFSMAVSLVEPAWSSGPILVGVVPISRRFRFPNSQVCHPQTANAQKTMPLIRIGNINKGVGQSVLHCVCAVTFMLGPEDFKGTSMTSMSLSYRLTTPMTST